MCGMVYLFFFAARIHSIIFPSLLESGAFVMIHVIIRSVLTGSAQRHRGQILQANKECGTTASIAVMRKVSSFSDYCKVFSVKFSQLQQKNNVLKVSNKQFL